MRKILTVSILTLAIAFFTASGARAAYWGLDPTGPFGPVDLGDTITLGIDLVNDSDDSIVVGSYSFCLIYDSTELDYLDIYTNTPRSPLIADYFGPAVDTPPDSVDNFNAGVIVGGFTLDPGTSTRVGTFDFEVVAAMIWDGLSDIDLYYRPLGMDGIIIDDVFTTIEARPGPDVGYVPIPGTVLLLGSGLAGLIGIRRRKS